MGKFVERVVCSSYTQHQFTNVIDQASRIIDIRFDFKGVAAKFERKDLTVTLFAESEFQVTQMLDMLRAALIKCGIEAKAMKEGEFETAGKQVKILVTMQNGLEIELAKKIVKRIKDEKMKVQSQIQGDQVRCKGKNAMIYNRRLPL